MSTLMGVKNMDFACMLCPIEAVREYDKDPTVHVVYPIIAIFPLMLPQDEKPKTVVSLCAQIHSRHSSGQGIPQVAILMKTIC